MIILKRWKGRGSEWSVHERWRNIRRGRERRGKATGNCGITHLSPHLLSLVPSLLSSLSCVGYCGCRRNGLDNQGTYYGRTLLGSMLTVVCHRVFGIGVWYVIRAVPKAAMEMLTILAVFCRGQRVKTLAVVQTTWTTTVRARVERCFDLC